MPLTPTEIAKLIADIPAVLDFYSAFVSAVAATKGETPVTRDFDILIAVAPKLKALAVAIEASLATP